MAKSKIQSQKGYSLFSFPKDYGTETQCDQAFLPGVLHSLIKEFGRKCLPSSEVMAGDCDKISQKHEFVSSCGADPLCVFVGRYLMTTAPSFSFFP